MLRFAVFRRHSRRVPLSGKNILAWVASFLLDRVVRLFLLTLLALFCCPIHASTEVGGRFMGFQVDRAMRLSGLSVPLRADEQGGLGRVVFGQVSVQSKKMGGLRIGILPELVIEEMRLEVPGNEPALLWMTHLLELLKGESLLQSAKIKGFTICDHDGGELLRAERGSVTRDGEAIQLSGVSIFPKSKKLPAVELALSGSQAGSVLIGKKRRPVPLFTSSNPQN